ncbi:MraZ protein [Anseongella ginsenosidimutans]|uniref:Transcriptional regulator MraZ n=1 Tax=Anseongella ginsenosidimutans TaxID=496056 RepID=A0A4R3L0C9_9SPHI|nr:division/cell wall cluster transcriptional repressor MraZ [Anseongella ginsenosidimutans]QEC50981.1 division/cell wall cluster transcriptional repressor MraZ [Anseongella ginsenosidimutans]TCS90370.1 MraZ protein [Anseongella ginsenosidimutans]
MTQFLGEYECKIDAKGRIMLPVGLRKQVSPEAQERFVVNRGFEQCLALYPYDEWQKISSEVNKLNLYNKKNRDFARYFFRGATELSLDGNGRILMPKPLLEYAGVKTELVLFAYSNRIEIWDKQLYDNLLTDEPEDFSALAEEVMGRTTERGNDGLS